MTVVIVGAGYSDLGAAISCHRRGFEVIVFEQAPELRRACSFIFLLTFQLRDSIGFSPNASRLLFRWGFGEAIRSIASKATYWTVRHWDTGEENIDSRCRWWRRTRVPEPNWISRVCCLPKDRRSMQGVSRLEIGLSRSSVNGMLLRLLTKISGSPSQEDSAPRRQRSPFFINCNSGRISGDWRWSYHGPRLETGGRARGASANAIHGEHQIRKG